MTKFGLRYPLWDHGSEPGSLLDRACGEVGIDWLTVPAVTGEFQAFRPFWFPDAPYFFTEGGWHFQPTARAYATSGIRPRAARWLAKRNALGEVSAAAAERGLQVLLLIDPLEAAGLFEPEPYLAQRDAWGEAWRPYRACWSHPAIRELLRETLDDLRRFEPAGFVLPQPRLDVPPAAGPTAATPLPAGVSLCFCASCKQVAREHGIDSEAAARAVRVLLTQPQPEQAVISADPVVRGYQQARTAGLRGWLQQLLSTQPLLFSDAALDLQPAGDAGPYLTASAPALARIPATEVVKAVVAAAGSGARYLEFTGLSEAPPDVLGTLQQAVRYARRGAA